MHAPALASPLLATKLHRPLPRPSAVARPRLFARVRRGLRGRLTLIAAPAGFGKSTLLAQALAAEAQVAWVGLDAGDNDPARFWSYVCTALERASPGLGEGALALLRAAPAVVEPATAELLNAVAASPAHVVLVLDDYHVISSPAIHERVGFLLDYAPPQLHLVIASRVDPPLPLARWRARGELVELRAADLRFTSDEALQFFADTMGLDLDQTAVTALEDRTEGWAAGLQLAALSLQGQADVRGFVASFSGSHRHVVDYLAEEVLARQPEHVRAFLLQTAVLDRLSGPLCDAVLGVADPAAGGDSYSRLMLDRLEQENLFLIPLDDERRWRRYHHLFGDLLRHRLQQERPALVAELHRRAAHWFAGQGAVAEAISHALAAGDANLAERLLAAHGPGFVDRGEARTLQGWLDALPRAALLANPRLCLVQAQVLVHDRRVSAVSPFLQAAEAGLDASGPDAAILRGELLTLRAQVAIEQGRVPEALDLARAAERLLPPEAYGVRSTNGLVRGYALMVLGQTDEAVEVYAANVRVCREAGNAVSGIFSANEIIKLRHLQGRLHDALVAADRALSWVAEAGWGQLPPASALHIWRGNVLIEQGNLDGAAEELAIAHRLTQAGITTARAHTFLARLRLLEGDAEGANSALAAVETLCRDWEPGGERVFFEAYVARLRLLAGDTEAARRWAVGREPWNLEEAPSYFRELELLTLARVAVLAPEGAQSPSGALPLLGWLRTVAASGGRGLVIMETLALEALAHARLGDHAAAHERLDSALALAAPEGLVGPFVDLGLPMGELLAQRLAHPVPSDLLRHELARLLDAFGASPPTAEPLAPSPAAPIASPSEPGAEALTEREREVLRLFAAGMTSAEIASHFVVSVNTVKTQLKSIYSKLDTHTRAELVARARALNLIP